jgi:hypothetical protein
MTFTLQTFRSFGLITVASGALAACGGGSTAVVAPDFAAFGDLTSQDTSVLAAASLDAAALTTTGLTGSLNRAANTASIGTLSGTINAARTEVALTAGGNVTFTSGANQYAVRYVATPTTGNRTIGVVGAVTTAASMPSGTATMTGPATVTIQDGVALYDLTGDAAIAANFGTNRVTTTLSGLDGTRAGGITPSEPVTDVATVTITGSTIAANTFSGGTATVTSTTLSPLGASANTSVNGTFFGPAGEEVGGVLLIDDTATGNIRVFGDFIGK